MTYPLLMTTSFIYNKKECINEESYELDHIKQTIELKKLSMSIALLVFLVIGIEWNNLDVFSSAYQKGFSITLPLGIHSGIILGYDHLSIPFILLLSFVFPVVFMSNWTTVKLGEMKYYLITILSSHYFLIIVFLVIDILMFYISFEIILPLFFILLGMFGGVQKFRAMYYLFLYTLWGSLFMLLEFLTKIGENGTGVMGLLEDLQLSSSWGLLGSIGIILAFSIKTPIVPFHLWLPLAHGDANVSGSIVLASIVLKMALYGFIRILIFILLLAFSSAQLTMFSIFIFSLLFASTTTMRQNDLKVLVAYSSVAHMGSTLLGGFSNNQFGIFGSILFSIAHGVVSPALFIFVGALFYDRIGSRIMNYLKGLVLLYPIAVAMLLLVIFGNMGTPLTANFVAELECILAAFMANVTMGILAALSIILSACYSIYMFNRISTGSISPYLATAPDTNKKEFSMLMPLIILMVLLGVLPWLISNPIDLGISHFLLNDIDSILSGIILIFSVVFNSLLIKNIYEIGKYFFDVSLLRFKILSQNIKNKLDNNFIWSGCCCSTPSKDDSDNDIRPDTGTSSNDLILHTDLSGNAGPLDAGSVSSIYLTGNNPGQEGVDNTPQVGTENPIQGVGIGNIVPDRGTDNSPQSGAADNLTQEGGNNATEEGGNNVIQAEGSNSSSGLERTTSDPVAIPERIDTTDPHLIHLTRGVPEEPSVLGEISGTTDNNRAPIVNIDELHDRKFEENITNPTEGLKNSDNENSGDSIEGAENNEEGNTSSANIKDSGGDDLVFPMDDINENIPKSIESNTEPIRESSGPNDSVGVTRGETSGITNEVSGETRITPPENPAGYTQDTSIISGETTKMINTNIDLNPSNTNVIISENGREDYTNSDLCLIENNYNLFSSSINTVSLDDNYSNINLFNANIIIISYGFAVVLGLYYIIVIMYKVLTNPKLEDLDNGDEDYTKIKFLDIDFTKSGSTRPDFVRSGAPSPETRPGTPGNEANGNGSDSSSDKEGSGKDKRRPSSGRRRPDRNGNGSSPSGDGNGSNNGKPSGGDGSSNGKP